MNHDRLDRLARRITACRACPLADTRNLAVPGEGDCRRGLMFVGEAPGEREDLTGRPFQGRSGRVLDELLAAAGLSREDIFLTSAIKCRPPGNRNPKAGERRTCREQWLEAQVEAADPDLILLLGLVAAKSVLGLDGPLRDLRGLLFDGPAGRPCRVTFHPAAALRFPSMRLELARDLAEVASLET